jgi:hypothetical protein
MPLEEWHAGHLHIVDTVYTPFLAKSTCKDGQEPSAKLKNSVVENTRHPVHLVNLLSVSAYQTHELASKRAVRIVAHSNQKHTFATFSDEPCNNAEMLQCQRICTMTKLAATDVPIRALEGQIPD